MIIKHSSDTFIEKFTRCAKVCGLFFLGCAFLDADWLGKQTSVTWVAMGLVFSIMEFL